VYWFTLNRLTGTTKNAVSNTEGFPGLINTTTHEITTTAPLRGSEGTATAWPAGTLVEILHSAGYMNRFIEGIEVSLNQDGSVKPTVVDGTKVYAADAGSTDAYAITLSPVPSAYAAGQTFRFKANTVNTGSATLNVNSLGAKTIKKNYNSDLADGDILANQLVEVIYDGTNFQLLSPISNTTVPVKTSGAAITTGTNDADFATPKALADAGVNTRLKTKIINATRDMTAASGDVSYTGVGFTPTAVLAMAWIEGMFTFSIGIADSSKTFSSLFPHSAANMGGANSAFYVQTGTGTTYQGATMKTYDADGFTLTWTKTSTPTGTAGLIFMCFR
jgi:hypothetical protein